MAAKITADGLYRITYGETPGLTADEYRARQPAKFAAMLPGHPGPGAYRVVDLAPYRMHQRCAPSLRVGRVLLAADAAHLCSPWGGLGITGGLVDAGGLADCLVGLWEGRADAAILDVYSAVRMDKWRTVIDPVSQENFRRVSDPDPDTRFERDDFLQMCVRGQEDEAVARTLLLGAMAIRYDFTQHFKDRPEGLPVGGTQDGADGQPHAVHPV